MPIGFDEIQVEKTKVGTIITLKFREKLDKMEEVGSRDCFLAPLLKKSFAAPNAQY